MRTFFRFAHVLSQFLALPEKRFFRERKCTLLAKADALLISILVLGHTEILTLSFGRRNMRCAIACLFLLSSAAFAADLESRVWTHYVPQDFLEKVVRTPDWIEIPLEVKGGVRKGDTVRIWTGGSIDWGNGDRPGQNFNGPDGGKVVSQRAKDLALSAQPSHAFAILFKTEFPGLRKPLPSGKPLEIKLDKDKQRLWIGFNDMKGLYRDNHLGKGRRHELDPMWMRIEVVRTIVD
jgi:hypothetical protein